MLPVRYDIAVVDLNNVYAANYAIRERKEYSSINEVVESGGVYGSMVSIKKILRDFLEPGGKVYFLADNPASALFNRKMISPDYKINRIERPKYYYRGLEILSLMIQNYSDDFIHIKIPNMEADDIVPVVISEIEEGMKVLLVSSDMDWARCIDYDGKSVTWYNFLSKKLFGKGEFHDKYGFDPSEDNIIRYKTYRGDRSDNIGIGLPYVPEDIVFRLMDYGDVEDVISDFENIDFLSDKVRGIIRENVPKLRLNYQLVSFVHIDRSAIEAYTIRCRFKPTTLRLLYEGLDFNIDHFDRRLASKVQKASGDSDDFFIQPRIRRV